LRALHAAEVQLVDGVRRGAIPFSYLVSFWKDKKISVERALRRRGL